MVSLWLISGIFSVNFVLYCLFLLILPLEIYIYIYIRFTAFKKRLNKYCLHFRQNVTYHIRYTDDPSRWILVCLLILPFYADWSFVWIVSKWNKNVFPASRRLVWLLSGPLENFHLTVKKLPKTWHFSQKISNFFFF